MNDVAKVAVEGCYLLHSEKLKNKIPICWLKFVLFALNVTERLPELTGTTADVFTSWQAEALVACVTRA